MNQTHPITALETKYCNLNCSKPIIRTRWDETVERRGQIDAYMIRVPLDSDIRLSDSIINVRRTEKFLIDCEKETIEDKEKIFDDLIVIGAVREETYLNVSARKVDIGDNC